MRWRGESGSSGVNGWTECVEEERVEEKGVEVVDAKVLDGWRGDGGGH